MKNPRTYFILAALSAMLLLGANCKTVTIKTVLRSNATIHREISVAGDSSGVGATAYPFSFREPWALTKKRDDNDSTKYMYTIHSNFSDIDDLNKELDYRADSIKVNAVAKLEKKFRWFYSYYHYEETFFSFFPFNQPPLQQYLTQEEYQLYLSGSDSSDIEDKVERYAQENFFHAFNQTLLKAVEKHPELGLKTADIENQQQALEQILNDWIFSSDDLTAAILTAGDSLLHPQHSLLDIRYEFADLDTTLDQYMAFLEKIIGEDYHVEVVMPGYIFDANANNTITNKSAVWEFDSDRFHFADYTMWVDSRRINIIPSVITVLIILLALLSFYISSRSNRRRVLEAQGVAWKDRKRFILFWPFSIALILVGFLMTIVFAWLFMLFNIDPEGQILDIFNATPTDNVIFVSLFVLGLFVLFLGVFHLTRFFKTRKKQKGASLTES